MMRQALRRRKPLSTPAKPLKFVAPTAGWRADVPVGDMPPDSAFSLINWFPEAGYTRVRNGSATYSSGLTGSVKTLIPYSGTSIKFFAAAGANIYDVTGGGAPSIAVSGFTNSHFSYSQISTAGGKFLSIVNGSDAPKNFDGATWTNLSATGGPTLLSSLSVVTTYRERLWFLEKNSTRLWYLGTQAIAGAMNSLDVGANMKFGGTLTALGTWTAEVASGVLQFLVVVSSEGEVLVFQGSNPADPTNWSLLGAFKLSPPLGGDRCMMNVGGDLAIMTNDAVIPISKAIQLDPSASDIASITAKIAPAWLDIVQTVGVNATDWQFIVFPRRRMAIVNVPDPAGTYQLAMNTETKSWCQFQGMPATCWAVWENNLYFGMETGIVMQADYGSNDNGAQISALSVGAWGRGDGMSQKLAQFVTLDMNFGVGASVFAGVSVDYNVATPNQPANPVTPLSGALWDVATWDDVTWPGSSPNRLIAAANAPTGVVLAPVVYAKMNGQTGQQSNCYLYGGSITVEIGSPI